MTAISAIPGLLTEQIAVVTGAAQGNGAAIARGFAASGAHVIAADINEAGACAIASEIRDAGGRAESRALDIADVSACQDFAASVGDSLGDVSILVNNAGILRRTGPDDQNWLDDLDQQIEVNLKGAARMVKVFLPQLRRTRGRVINLGSIASFISYQRVAGYAASKGGVLQLTKALAADLACDGIRVNGIAPGAMITPMSAPTRSDPDAVGLFVARTPMGRMGEPEELVGAALFLSSDMSTYVTGTMLPVDGGYLAI